MKEHMKWIRYFLCVRLQPIRFCALCVLSVMKCARHNHSNRFIFSFTEIVVNTKQADQAKEKRITDQSRKANEQMHNFCCLLFCLVVWCCFQKWFCAFYFHIFCVCIVSAYSLLHIFYKHFFFHSYFFGNSGK